MGRGSVANDNDFCFFPVRYYFAFIMKTNLLRTSVFTILFLSFSTIIFAQQQWDQKYSASEGLVLFKYKDKYGFLDENNKLVIPCEYEDASSFSEGLAAVKKNGKYGFINKSETLVVPYQYQHVVSFYEGLAVVKQNGKLGFINKLGKTVIPIKYQEAKSFQNGIAAVKLNGYWGFIDNTGATIIPFKYEDCGSYSDGLIKAYIPDAGWKMGYIDINHKTVIPFEYNSGFDFQDGLCFVTRDPKSGKKYGVINKKGTMLTSFKYDWAHDFEKGYALVKIGDKWGVLDRTGKEVVPPTLGFFDASTKREEWQSGKAVAVSTVNKPAEKPATPTAKSGVKTVKTWAGISRLIKKPVSAMQSQVKLENFAFTNKNNAGDITSYKYKDASDIYFIQGQGDVSDTYTVVEYEGNTEAVSFSLMGRKDDGIMTMMDIGDDFEKEILAAGFVETKSDESDYGSTVYYRHRSLGLTCKMETTSVMGFKRYVDVYVYGDGVRMD